MHARFRTDDRNIEKTTTQIFSTQSQSNTNDLLARAIDAHGGLDRWSKFNRVTATVVGGGGLWPMKGLAQDPNPREVTVTLHEKTASISPYGQPDWRIAFTPDRIAIETTMGALVGERVDPRASFAGHVMDTPWDSLHRAYFSGVHFSSAPAQTGLFLNCLLRRSQ